ncbi:conserved hypothetical protein [Theileria equi strain WA]|uniref:Uncharacterized protein n=1 Tax=Theileria equi strain WA TaxID=1537102 RepID=L1LBI4_THEEQ|nr:conserved hypothetical protein [Theileria equi strain WA]EKX72635.1 conserved hypothetical protein [Theileria equi strain WA]|eukprot:XP_004832087.1 conserved hypothetical protein [Theileria equi strain WA]
MASTLLAANRSILRVLEKTKHQYKICAGFSSFRFADEKKTAEESVYFKKQEEAILSRMLKRDPSLDPRYSAPSHELNIYNDLSLALAKFGINDPPLALMEELVLIFTNNGYKKSD